MSQGPPKRSRSSWEWPSREYPTRGHRSRHYPALAAWACIHYHSSTAMKRNSLLIVIGLALLGLAAVVAAAFLHDGLSARATPGRLETFVARNARRLATPSYARLAQNPLLATEEDLRVARMHFADHCAI